MDFTKSFVKAKNPCADGFRWYLRHHREGSDYQKVLDDLVNAGRVEDACWLLEKVGATNTVLELDRLEADAVVYAGSIHVRGSIEVASTLRAGGFIRCGGFLRAGSHVHAGDDIKAGGGLNCGADLRCAGSVLANWHVNVAGQIQAGALKVGGSVSCGGRMEIAGPAWVKGDLLVGGDLTARALSVRGRVESTGSLRVTEGVVCDDDLACGMHLDAGRGIRSAGDIVAAGAIRAGESLDAEGRIQAGDGYGVFAGLSVQREDWATSARVRALQMPGALMSGFWSGPQGSAECACILPGLPEVEDAH
ncbi:MAG: hypothetical protein JWP22_3913 [Ramlibacter sp.]|nr:hypothetical protein [Ramlibacter sp.]